MIYYISSYLSIFLLENPVLKDITSRMFKVVERMRIKKKQNE